MHRVELGQCEVPDHILNMRRRNLAGERFILSIWGGSQKIPVCLEMCPSFVDSIYLEAFASIDISPENSIAIADGNGGVHILYGGTVVRFIYRIEHACGAKIITDVRMEIENAFVMDYLYA